MGRHTRNRRVHNRRKTKQRGGLTAEQKASMASLGSALKPSFPMPRAPPTRANVNPKEVMNDPFAVYKKMSRMGQPQEAIIQKMKKNGKTNEQILSLFPDYGKNTAKNIPADFTLKELRDLKDYVDRSEIIVRLKKIGTDPNEFYPELSETEINDIIQDYSKPTAVKETTFNPVIKNSGKSMMNELSAKIKSKPKINNINSTISFFTDYTDKERQDLNNIESSNKRIKDIETINLPAAKDSIKKSEFKGEKLKHFQLKAIIDLLGEKRKLEDAVSELLTEELKNKIKFVQGKSDQLMVTYDMNGPLPKGWGCVVNSKDNDIRYRNKYTQDIIIERPTEEALPVPLPEGWELVEDDIEAWYHNKVNHSTQWLVPTEPA